jgi:sulfatase maturation enzyme AslB (radical SAM superfamily)
MRRSDVLRAWGRILQGEYPTLSIEITRECPLKCPGCYAYEPDHLNGLGPLRTVSDYKGDDLIREVMKLVQRYKPLHLSIVGGEPLVRFRELNLLLPQISELGIAVQLVTSAVRPIPEEWAGIKNLSVVVSIDGLQPEHDVRRSPATYERILKNIQGHRITVHCTITRQMLSRSGYFEEFLSFWSQKSEVRKIWFSLFTPQKGADSEEILLAEERTSVLSELASLRTRFPKLELPDLVIKGFTSPPKSPESCIFALTTLNFTADLKGTISPCQFGGDPDCSQCGCMASAGLNALGEYRLLNLLPVKSIFKLSHKVGQQAGLILRK